MAIEEEQLEEPTIGALTADAVRPIEGDEVATEISLNDDLTSDDIDKIMEVTSIAESPKDQEFYKNMVEDMPQSMLDRLSSHITDLVSQDDDDNSKAITKYEEALKRTGLGGGEESPGGASFDGASRVVHPLLSEGAIDFQSNTIKALIPADGPVKVKTDDNFTEERMAKAYRIEKKLNRQFMYECSEYVPSMDKMLSQVPLNGEQYLKVMWDFRHKRPKFEYVPSDYILIPGAANDFYSSDRFTHRQDITTPDYETRISNGLYYDLDASRSPMPDPSTAPEMANEKISGISKESDGDNLDGQITLYETHIMLNLNDFADNDDYDEYADYDYVPYIVTRRSDTDKVVAIYRNWMPDDPGQERMEWIVPFQMIPWRGPKAIGLIQIAGSLAVAATGALRALMDAAHIENMPGMLKMKGARLSGQNIDVQPTQITEISADGTIDDIRKLIMPIPFKGPSPTLFQLLGFVVSEARGVVRTSMDDIAETNANVPVGTTLARIEQGMKVFSSIYMRLHRSQQRVIDIVCRLNFLYLEMDEDLNEEEMENAIRPEDFEGDNDIIPVSDPNMYSDVQRIAQVQGVMQLAEKSPQLYDLRAVNKMMLEAMRVPNIDQVLPAPVDQKDENPVTENVKMGMGQGAFALPDQDHMAHIKVHIDWIRNPMFGKNPMFQPMIPLMFDHIKQHMLLFYASSMEKLASAELGKSVSKLIKGKLSENVEVMNGLSKLLALISQEVNPMVDQSLKQLAPDVEAMYQTIQSMQPQPPMDPGTALVKQTELQEQTKQQKNQTDSQLKEQDLQIRKADSERDSEVSVHNNDENNETKLILAGLQSIDNSEEEEEPTLPVNPNGI